LFESFLGPQGFFCSALAGVAGASAAFAIGAEANPANAKAKAATVDFLDIIFPLKVLNFL
jgi:hypothetical protein